MTSFETELRTGFIILESGTAEEPPFLEVRPPWAWAVATASIAVVTAITAFLFFGRIESVETIRGMVLPASGVLSVSSEKGGIARRILVSPGQEVRAGDPLVVIESGEARVGRAAAVDDLRLTRDGAQRSAYAEDAAFVRELAEMERRRDLLSQRQQSLERSDKLSAATVAADVQMQANGLISRSQSNRDQADLEQATRLLIENQQELASLDGEINASRLRHTQQELERRHDVDRSAAGVRTADLKTQDEIVKAALPGIVDTVIAHEGQIVRSGQMLLRVMPRSSALRVICYIPERDRQRIRIGTPAVIALDQLRGDRRFSGRIVRISDFLGVRDEIDATLGWAVPVDYAGYRVDIVIDGEESALLRPGMLGDVNVRLGRVRPVSLLLGNARPKVRTDTSSSTN